MIYDIYAAIKELLHPTSMPVDHPFADYAFFSSESDRQQGKQNKTKVPYLRLVFVKDVGKNTGNNRNRIEKTALYRLDVVAKTDATDKDDVTRLSESQGILQAVEELILFTQDGAFLGINCVKDVRIVYVAENVKSVDAVETQAFTANIEIEYYRTLRK